MKDSGQEKQAYADRRLLKKGKDLKNHRKAAERKEGRGQSKAQCSAYTGGGRNVYWDYGWANGVTYTNEDLLQSFLACCRRFPGIDFIGAHQLHLGWERLDALFAAHPNLLVDTSVGCRLRAYDNFYAHDKAFIRDFFMKWPERVVFGTDAFLGDAPGKVPDERNYIEHIRFIMSLDLPERALDAVCRGNMERMLRV